MFSTHLQDVSATYDLREKFPGRVQLLRFEDLANDPYTVRSTLTANSRYALTNGHSYFLMHIMVNATNLPLPDN